MACGRNPQTKLEHERIEPDTISQVHNLPASHPTVTILRIRVDRMWRNQGSKDAASSLGEAISVVQRTSKLCDTLAGSTDLPEAFPVVASRLPVVIEALFAIKQSVTTISLQRGTRAYEEERYSSVARMGREIGTQVTQLETLYKAVTLTDGDQGTKLAQYRMAVGKGERLEKVMKKLLDSLIHGSTAALVGEEFTSRLRAALEEVRRLPASLEDGDSDRHSFTNYGSGNQFNHAGSGSMNANLGNGPQITGDATHATMNFGSPQKTK